MTTYNLIPNKIRILANTDYYTTPKPNIPIDVEGTCITLETYGSTYYDKEIKAGNILDVLFSEPEDDIEVFIRWDNDTKTYMTPGSIIHRSSAISKCMSIWLQNPQDGLYTDERPYYDLKPRYHSKGKYSRSKFIQNAIKNINTYIPPSFNTEQIDDPPEERSEIVNVQPSIFKTIEGVPIKHPNAAVILNGKLRTVKKSINIQGQIETKIGAVSIKFKTPYISEPSASRDLGKPNIKTDPTPLTVFRNTYDVPIGHPNAVVREGNILKKITKHARRSGKIVTTIHIIDPLTEAVMAEEYVKLVLDPFKPAGRNKTIEVTLPATTNGKAKYRYRGFNSCNECALLEPREMLRKGAKLPEYKDDRKYPTWGADVDDTF